MYSEQVYGLLENLVFKVPVMYVKVFCLMHIWIDTGIYWLVAKATVTFKKQKV